MGLVNWLKHHWWWLSVPAGLALERLLAAVSDVSLLGGVWVRVIDAGTSLAGWLVTDVAFPVWLALSLLVIATTVIVYLRHQRSRLASVTAELEKLKNPEAVTLDAIEERVLFWATKIYDAHSTGEGPIPAFVASISGISLTTVEAALDVLKQKGLVRLKKFKSAPIDLTPEGRAYMAKKDVISRFAAFHFTAKAPG